MFMKKKYLLLFCAFFLTTLLLSGCGKESADQYVGEQITSMKEKDTDAFTAFLEKGIAESNDQFTLQFPEELKQTYTAFLQEAFKTMEFEVQKAKENDDGTYSVKVSFTPIDIPKTTDSTVKTYVETMSSTDLTAEATALLDKSTKLLKDSPEFGKEILTTINVEKKDDGFSISEDSMNQFLEQAIPEYMKPYDTLCNILDVQDFLKAYLDASFKGEVTQFAKHTDRTEEEALKWYEDDVFTPPSDLSSSYKDRYVKALKEIMKKCEYTVGIPKKEDGIYSYTIDVTLTPNNSITKTYEKLENGTYYSIDAVSKDLVETMEKYAKSPDYGKETTMTISFDLSAMLSSASGGSDLNKLAEAILPIPD